MYIDRIHDACEGQDCSLNYCILTQKTMETRWDRGNVYSLLLYLLLILIYSPAGPEVKVQRHTTKHQNKEWNIFVLLNDWFDVIKNTRKAHQVMDGQTCRARTSGPSGCCDLTKAVTKIISRIGN